MKLSISNIAWTAELDDIMLLRLQGKVAAIEIAPTRLWSDWQFTEADVNDCLQTLARHDLVCSSLQAIVFGKPDLKLFGTPDQRIALVEHLKRVADLSAMLRARPMVFGAPKNRDRGDLDTQTAFSTAADVFSEVGDYCAQRQVCLCIEPNPPAYGCNFITNSQQGIDLVQAVNSPGFRLHLDAAGMHLAGDDASRSLTAAADVLEHIHISEPNLSDFANPQVDHAQVAHGLRNIGWDKWISIEMRASTDPIKSVEQSIAIVRELYQGL